MAWLYYIVSWVIAPFRKKFAYLWTKMSLSLYCKPSANQKGVSAVRSHGIKYKDAILENTLARLSNQSALHTRMQEVTWSINSR